MNATFVSKASTSLARGGAQGRRSNHADDNFLDRALGVDPRRSVRPLTGSRAGIGGGLGVRDTQDRKALRHPQGSRPAAVSTSGIPLGTAPASAGLGI